jgi:hypothetical protein
MRERERIHLRSATEAAPDAHALAAILKESRKGSAGLVILRETRKVSYPEGLSQDRCWATAKRYELYRLMNECHPATGT